MMRMEGGEWEGLSVYSDTRTVVGRLESTWTDSFAIKTLCVRRQDISTHDIDLVQPR